MNKNLKIAIIFGTRPEAIKIIPVIRELQSKKIKVSIIVTNQHQEMLSQVLELFKIKPDHRLNIMRKNQSIFDVMAVGLKKLKPILEVEKPDLVLVQGDTMTTLVGALAAYFLKIPVGHVEAGLRTHNKFSPFPEEMNRQLVSRLADFNFAPTRKASANLLREGILKNRIFITGNTGIDALLSISNSFENLFLKKLILITAHRRESFGRPLKSICEAILAISKKRDDVEIVFQVHKNPAVSNTVFKILGGKDKIMLTPPMEYEFFVSMMKSSYLILTDSGGIQEEASVLGKPVLVLRNHTERMESVKAGVSKLIGTSKVRIVKEVERLLDDKKAYGKMARKLNLYGDGKASQRIVKIIERKMCL